SLVMSFFVSRTVTPLLCLKILKSHGEARGVGGFITRVLDRLDHAYARVLGWVLSHRAVVIVSIVALCGSSCGLVTKIGNALFPDSDEGQFQVIYKAPIGTRVERTEQIAMHLEDVIERELGGAYTTKYTDNGLPLGRTALFTANTGQHAGNLNVNLVRKDER